MIILEEEVKLDSEFRNWKKIELNVYKKILESSKYILDGIFGINLNSEVRYPFDKYLNVLAEVNSYSTSQANKKRGSEQTESGKNDKIIISVDIASGLDCNTSKWHGPKFEPSVTYTMQYSKSCLENLKLDFEIIDLDIDVRANNYSHFSHFTKFWIERKPNSHKGANGRVIVIGGSEEITGAPSLATNAILRTGVDTVRTVVPSEIAPIVASYSENFLIIKAPGTHFHPKHLKDIVNISLKFHDVALLGMGITNEEGVKEFTRAFVRKTNKHLRLVLDAEGIRAYQGKLSELKRVKAIITPHKAELEYLLQEDIPINPQKLIKFLEGTAKELNLIIVLKGNIDIITDGNRTILNKRGHPGMTVGGSGDVLAGIIAASLCFIKNRFFAVVVGVYIMGLAGELAGRKYGNALLATDIIEEIPSVLLSLESKRN